MDIYSEFTAIPAERAGPRAAVTIGNFDGVHRGHRALLERVEAHAAASGLQRAVLTFQPHPVRVLAPSWAPPLITRIADKRRLLARAGVEVLLEQAFDRTFAALTPDVFVKRVLVDALRAAVVVVGYDFTFGARRAGTTDTLRALGESLGFDVEVVSARSIDGLVASSTKVREFVLAGEVAGAAALLGRPYHVVGVVSRGARRGRTIGFPTANIETDAELLPSIGVYAGWLDWGARPRRAVINCGYNPTFEGTRISLEAHVLEPELSAAERANGGPDLYDKPAALYFEEHLREERRFDGIDSLVAQITQDRDTAAACLAGRLEPPTFDLPGSTESAR